MQPTPERRHRPTRHAAARRAVERDIRVVAASLVRDKVPEPPPPDLPPLEPDELPEEEPEPDETPAPQQPEQEPVPA